MYLMYVDESGDTGLPPPNGGSPTRYFCLTGLVVHELHWASTMADILRFRYWLKSHYGIFLEDELHAAEMIAKPRNLPKSLRQLKKFERLAVLRHHADQLSRLANARLINVCIDKQTGERATSDEIFQHAWYTLFQRFENTILHKNFPGPVGTEDRGLVFADETDAHTLKSHLNQMRQRNPLTTKQRDGSRTTTDKPVRLLIEDPVCRNSRDSYFIQAVDCAAYLFKQSLDPNSYMKRHGANAYFSKRLRPVLCTHAAYRDPLGVVRL